MPRAFLLCITIVAAFQLHPAAASPDVDDVQVTPAVTAAAVRLGIDPAADRARFVPEIIRLLYTHADDRGLALQALRSAAVRAESPSSRSSAITVPLPLSPALWSRAVLRRRIPGDDLLTAILTDRRAALLAFGLYGLDDETLAYLAGQPALVTALYEGAAPAFAAFADAVHVKQGRIVPPGGESAGALWEAVVGEPASDPDRFIPALFAAFDGRLAYLYQLVADAEPPTAAFAIGAWLDAGQRQARFEALADACIRSYREWRIDSSPFQRPLNDLSVLLLRVHVDPSGAPKPPASRAFWANVFGRGTAGAAPGLVDAAWLLDVTGDEDMYVRGDLLDAFEFGQRVFGSAPEAAGEALAQTLKGFGAHRMLMLTLERIGVRAPSVYAMALRHADAVAAAGSDRRFWTLSQFQGSLALIDRMRRAGTLREPEAVSLIQALCAVPLKNGSFDGGVARWLSTELARALPPGASWEERAIVAMAGVPAAREAPKVFWEGESYRLDMAFAERRRLELVREKQGGHTVDMALAIGDAARALRESSLTVARAREVSARLEEIAAGSADRLRRPAVNLMPPGVDAPPDGLEWLNKARDDLDKTIGAGNLRRAAATGASLQELGDIVLANALVSLAYAADIGDPDGSALLGGNVALRHDYGFARRDTPGRARAPWSVPHQDFMPGVPWHVTGSLIGLDIALAPLSLRRVTTDITDAPRLPSLEREAFALTVSLMDPTRLTDRDRDAIAGAIARGRERVARLADGAESLDAVAELAGIDGWRRRAIDWQLRHEPGAVASRFSLAELLALGGGAPGADLDAWGATGFQAWSCACNRFPARRMWSFLAGRPQMPLMAAAFAELNLELAMMLAQLKLPAALAKPVLASAVQDFIDRAAPADPNDWWGLVRDARTLERNRFEDYVAAAAIVDGPLVPEEAGESPER